jgi:hypothetical protein
MPFDRVCFGWACGPQKGQLKSIRRPNLWLLKCHICNTTGIGQKMQMNGHTLKCDYSVSEAIGSIILWIIISVFTFGLGLFVMPYYILKGPINKTSLVDQQGMVVGKLYVEVNLSEIIGHAVIWVLLAIVTLGLAFFVYYPAVVKRLLNGVVIR